MLSLCLFNVPFSIHHTEDIHGRVMEVQYHSIQAQTQSLPLLPERELGIDALAGVAHLSMTLSNE